MNTPTQIKRSSASAAGIVPSATLSATALATACCAGPNICTACFAPLIVTLLNRTVWGLVARLGARTARRDVKPSLLLVSALAKALSAALPRGPMMRSMWATSLPSPTSDSPTMSLLIFAMRTSSLGSSQTTSPPAHCGGGLAILVVSIPPKGRIGWPDSRCNSSIVGAQGQDGGSAFLAAKGFEREGKESGHRQVRARSGVDPARFERRVPVHEPALDLMRMASRGERARPVRRLAADRLGGARAKFPRDMRVGDRAQKREIDGERRPARIAVPFAGRGKRRQAESENVLVGGDILPCDPVPLRRLRHRFSEGRRRGGIHVVPGDASEAAGIGGGNGRENVGGVRLVESIEDKRQRRAQGAAASLGGRSQRRAEKDDSEIGVLTDRLKGRLDRGADADSDPRAPGRNPSGARFRAANEVGNLHAVAGREPMHVAGLQRVELGEARLDIGRRDAAVVTAHRARRFRAQRESSSISAEAIASAMLRLLTLCRPLHAGMLLTSSTVGAPSAPTITSTPAI